MCVFTVILSKILDINFISEQFQFLAVIQKKFRNRFFFFHIFIFHIDIES